MQRHPQVRGYGPELDVTNGKSQQEGSSFPLSPSPSPSRGGGEPLDGGNNPKAVTGRAAGEHRGFAPLGNIVPAQ